MGNCCATPELPDEKKPISPIRKKWDGEKEAFRTRRTSERAVREARRVAEKIKRDEYRLSQG